MANTNTAVYSNQQKTGNASTTSSYYPANAYDDNMQSGHSSTDYNKSSYANKQTASKFIDGVMWPAADGGMAMLSVFSCLFSRV